MKGAAASLLVAFVATICGCSSTAEPSTPPPSVVVLSQPPLWRIAQERAGLFVVCARCGQPTPKSAWHAQGPSASGLPPIITIPTLVLSADAGSSTPRAPRTPER